LVLGVLLLAGVEGLYAQGKSAQSVLPKGWHLLDKEKDGFYGISLAKAYEFIREKKLKSKTVIVADLDTGIDTAQEDLHNILWTNPKEIPGNGIDDDHNGYVDDIHGWNFLGGKDGRNVKDDSPEGTRVYYAYKQRFENKDFDPSTLSPEDKEVYAMWSDAKKKLMGDGTESGVDLVILRKVVAACIKSDSILQKAMGKTEYTGNDLDSFKTTTTEARSAKSVLMFLFREDKIMDMTNTEFLSEYKELADGEERKADAKLNPPKEYRHDIVQDDETNINDRYYGNNDLMADDPVHGTHVSGIIAAERDNGKGMNGIADNVRIMEVRVIPNGDEHDKDIALGIRYAVDNGAKVINMSFGKSFSPQKAWVDDAVRYAESKGVILIHAAGNESENVDSVANFPNPVFKDNKGTASNWITVGASSDPLAEADFKSYTASFSNYGKKQVDVFAPGTKIYSTLPGGNKYGNLNGTSMAAPVVAGIAALIMEYFPNLSPAQVKHCIEKSVVAPNSKVKKPGSTDEMVNLSELCRTGGITNAYGAIKLAYALDEELKKKETLPKSTLINNNN